MTNLRGVRLSRPCSRQPVLFNYIPEMDAVEHREDCIFHLVLIARELDKNWLVETVLFDQPGGGAIAVVRNL